MIIIIIILILLVIIFISIKKENFMDLENVEIKKKKKIKCKFFPSYSKGYICPNKYNNHLGATFSAKSKSGLMCNGKKIKANPCKAYAIVKNKSINQIKIIDRGNGYKKPPKIKIIGNGKNARAKGFLDKSGSVEKIEITNPGQDYTDTPKIKIEGPNGYTYCHLCCSL